METSHDEPRLLNVERAAQYMATTVNAIRSLWATGGLPYLVIGRRHLADRADLDTYISKHKRRESPVFQGKA